MTSAVAVSYGSELLFFFLILRLELFSQAQKEIIRQALDKTDGEPKAINDPPPSANSVCNND